MFLQSLKYAGWPALLAGGALAACSKTAATGDAYVNAAVGGGTGNLCATFQGSSQPFLQIGAMRSTGAVPSTVPDGTGPVSIDCTVSPGGGGFDLQLGALGAQGGQLTVRGHVDGTTGGTVSASFVSQMYGVFQSSNCTLTYTYEGQPVPYSPPVTAGGIFAHIDCPSAQMQGGQEVNGSPVTCDANADFLFQNCAQ